MSLGAACCFDLQTWLYTRFFLCCLFASFASTPLYWSVGSQNVSLSESSCTWLDCDLQAPPGFLGCMDAFLGISRSCGMALTFLVLFLLLLHFSLILANEMMFVPPMLSPLGPVNDSIRCTKWAIDPTVFHSDSLYGASSNSLQSFPAAQVCSAFFMASWLKYKTRPVAYSALWSMAHPIFIELTY